MPISPRKQSRKLRKPKPYERRAYVHWSSGPSLSDNEDEDENDSPAPTPSLNTADKPGFPTYNQYKRIEIAYLESLSSVKRDKALISQSTYDKISDVLCEPDTHFCTPQFRFWVRKMFTLGEADEDEDTGDVSVVVLHDDKPVAVQEWLYQILCRCHAESGHGGRDRTFAVIRQHYSWVPKDVAAQFIKVCPTCISRRGDSAFKILRERTTSHRLKEEQSEESDSSLSQRGFLQESSRFTASSLRHAGQSAMSPDRTVDVASPRDNASQWPSTCLPSYNLQAPLPRIVLSPSPFLPSKVLSVPHSRQMFVDFTPNGLLPLTSHTTSRSSRSSSADVRLPSLSAIYWDNANDDQYKLNDLWPENISDSLPPELQRFQLSGPVRAQRMRNYYIDPALLTSQEASGGGEAGYMSDVSPMSPYSSLSSGASGYSSVSSYSSASPYSIGSPYSSVSPYSSMSPGPRYASPICDLGQDMMSSSLSARLDLLYPESHDGSMSPPAFPRSFSPPFSSPMMSPFTSAPTSATFDEGVDDELLRAM